MESKALRQLKLRHLLAFVEIIRSGSLKAAAARMNLTQPAISKTLKELETILAAPLLARNRSGIALTREGAVFHQFAEQGLATLGHGVASLDALRAGSAAPLRVGALPSASAALLPAAILQFAALSPSTPLQVADGQIGALVADLRAGELDLVVGRMGPPEAMTGLSFTQLLPDRVIFAVAADHPRAATLTLPDLAEERVLFPPRGAAIRDAVDRFLIARGATGWARAQIETVSVGVGRALTLGPARAVWVISLSVVAADIAAGRMVALPIDTDEMAGPIGIMSRAEEDPTPAIRLFRQALTQAAADQAGSPIATI